MMEYMHVVILTGGPAGSRFVGDLVAQLPSETRLSVIVNTSGDLWAHALKVCPDIDLICRALRVVPAAETSRNVSTRLNIFDLGPTWLSLDDEILAHAIVRTELLHAGFSLGDAVLAMSRRLGIAAEIIPMSHDRVEQHVIVHDADGVSRAVHRAEYFARPAAPDPEPGSLTLVTADDWAAAPEAVGAITTADLLVVTTNDAPLTTDPILATPRIAEAIDDFSGMVLRVDASDSASALHEVCAGLA